MESPDRDDAIDIDLSQLQIHEQLRANASFMKIMATLFHYGNPSMNAAQLVAAVRTLNLLALRGETPKSTIQGIISTARKIARELNEVDPFYIERQGIGRHAKYSISESVLNGAVLPPLRDVPDEQQVFNKPAAEEVPSSDGAPSRGKRQRKAPTFYSPPAIDPSARRRPKRSPPKLKTCSSQPTPTASENDLDFNNFDDLSSSELSEEEEIIPRYERKEPSVPEQDTVNTYSLYYSAPAPDMDYIDAINFKEYPIAAHFGIAQQKGYAYPRFRSHEKIKIHKMHCEDKFRVADIINKNKTVGRIYVLADGHGGSGCSEFFVRNTASAMQRVCQHYDPTSLETKHIQQEFERDIKNMVESLDEEYLEMKRKQIEAQDQDQDVPLEEGDTANHTFPHTEQSGTQRKQVENDGCTLVINLFFGEWLVNVNVGDSRSILFSIPESVGCFKESDGGASTSLYQNSSDNNYKMDVVFASQDHKPYLEHLAREIIENGGEFVDSVQNRVIKVELDKLKEDTGRNTKRFALRNARIRPKGSQENGSTHPTSFDTCAQIRPLRASVGQYKVRARGRVPSLNVARSCGDLDFKMVPNRKIISCEPDVNFFRIVDTTGSQYTTSSSISYKSVRYFLFMSTDGTFDYMSEEIAERQNKAIGKIIGSMIEEGEKMGEQLLQEQDEKEQQQKYVLAEDEEVMDVDIPNGTSRKPEANGVQKQLVKATERSEQSSFAESDSHNEIQERRVKERTLVTTARYFVNRESANGFFAPTLQEYDDCTIILIEI
ncbi:hypothetical protein EC973_004668 [Apophysomyces ossiformis]|uniref:PPM-type phosphatase domain-containing protein n=1 Tax=Apophysomyces ossiformis TaxID=679940 RepID=A0A8H7BFV7_9FUNG|nr:hypothetical protein EC973_004668 [Apophysomyces ossiformis]